jgi:hypothetical protein
MVIGKREVGGPVTHSTGVLQHACSYENNTLQVWAPFRCRRHDQYSCMFGVWPNNFQRSVLSFLLARALHSHTRTHSLLDAKCVFLQKNKWRDACAFYLLMISFQCGSSYTVECNSLIMGFNFRTCAYLNYSESRLLCGLMIALVRHLNLKTFNVRNNNASWIKNKNLSIRNNLYCHFKKYKMQLLFKTS